MRRIEVKKWSTELPIDGKVQTVSESLLTVITMILNNNIDKTPKGMDGFRIFSRLSNAFEVAEKEGMLTLEETDFKFLKDFIEQYIPGNFGANKNIAAAVDNFLNAKEEK